MSMITLFLAIILIFLISSSLFVSCNSVSPIYMDTVFQKHGNFENFENNSMNEYKKHLFDKSPDACKNVHGINGLFCSPDAVGNNLDKFANAEGKLDCKNNSGLSNSKGGLCLDDEHMRLLRTRGGNSTNCDVTDAGNK